MSVNEIIQGDCLEVIKSFPDNYFVSIVTDPPYGLSFMGKGWDYEVPGIEYWKEAHRVLKPGGNLLAMGGTRTFHRQICAIEDAGFEIRDCLMWIYGSGFPKSHNHFGIEGYGTALKPAYEPITLAMKPLDGTFSQNAEKWGQAGININGSRIGTNEKLQGSSVRNDIRSGKFGSGHRENPGDIPDYQQSPKGRWPANVIFDEEAAKMLDEQSGIEASRFFYCAKASSRERNEGLEGLPDKLVHRYGEKAQGPLAQQTPSKGVIEKNNHPTVKPIKLMEYLIKLVMPPSNGLLLDPFAGSGSTILAAKGLGFDAIGIEKQPEYCEIARARINYIEQDPQLDMFQGIV